MARRSILDRSNEMENPVRLGENILDDIRTVRKLGRSTLGQTMQRVQKDQSQTQPIPKTEQILSE